jgi:hypothetical protein
MLCVEVSGELPRATVCSPLTHGNSRYLLVWPWIGVLCAHVLRERLLQQRAVHCARHGVFAQIVFWREKFEPNSRDFLLLGRWRIHNTYAFLSPILDIFRARGILSSLLVPLSRTLHRKPQPALRGSVPARRRSSACGTALPSSFSCSCTLCFALLSAWYLYRTQTCSIAYSLSLTPRG